MREPIQILVSDRGFDCIRVDHGAFTVGINCCSDNSEAASCKGCDKECEIENLIKCERKCPLAKYCNKNMRWRAY